jgi:hypothetical protein
VDPSDVRLYHLVLDTTVLDVERAVEVLLTATRAFFAANP